jgi:hypothetical protein
MFIVECILFILAVVLFLISNKAKNGENDKCSKILFAIAAICGVAWVIIGVITWPSLIFGYIMLTITLCLYPVFITKKWKFGKYWILIFLTSVVFLINGLSYVQGIRYADEPEIRTTRLDIISIERTSSVGGSLSGNGSFLYGQIKGSVSKQEYYDLDYVLDGGGKMFLSIPAEGTPRYDLKDGEKPFVLVIEESLYLVDYNVESKPRFWPKTTVRYELYLPEGTIPNNL